MAVNKFILFEINGENYGIDINRVNGIETAVNITSSPNMPSFMLGMINLRGNIIPVVSLRKKFNVEEIPNDSKTQYIITMNGASLIAFKVDAVSEIAEVADESLYPVPVMVKGTNTDYVNRVATVNGKLVVIIDIEGVLSDAEFEKVEGIVNAMK